MIKRRDFLAGGLSLGAATALSPLALAQALIPKDQYFLGIYMQGGWDVTLGLDPWTSSMRPLQSDMFIEYTADKVQAADQLYYGPAMSPLSRWLDRCVSINGIFLSPTDNGHDAPRHFMDTGSAGTGNSITAEVSALWPSALGVLAASRINAGPLNTVVTNTNYISNLRSGRTDTSVLENYVDSIVHNSALVKAERKYLQSVKFEEPMQKLLTSLGNLSGLPAGGLETAVAFAAGASRSAQLEISGQLSFDTHSQHPVNHLNAQKTAWESVSALLTLLNRLTTGTGKSILDSTYVYIYSEFSRTAALNSTDGKDHNPLTNSCLIMGPGIQGGRSYGKSKVVTAKESAIGSSYHIALPYDYQAGRAIEVKPTTGQKVEFIYPDNVLASLFAKMNIASADYPFARKNIKLVF